ncbi:MAG TPA: hypothetical protein VNL36_05285 [Bacteroidota bacterium]|nr:hypothetical protein [Bacteroidota bacterium]
MLAVFLIVVSMPTIAQEEEPESQWDATLGTRFLSQYVSYGIELSDRNSALQPSFSLAHASGFGLELDGIYVLGGGGRFQQWSIALEYERTFSDWLTLGAEVSHFEYQSDTVSILSSLSNSLSFSLDADFDIVSVGLSYDTFFGANDGTNGARYFGMNVSTVKNLGDLTFVPLIQATWMSQEVLATLAKNKGQSGKALPKAGTAATTVSVTGLSSVSFHLIAVYSLSQKLSLTFNPYFLYAPKSELSTHKTQFLATFALSYAFGW